MTAKCRFCGTRKQTPRTLGCCPTCYAKHAQPKDACVMCGHVRRIVACGRCDTCYRRVKRYGIIGAEVQLRRGPVRCDICRENPGTAVDHDHSTKWARGRLCKSCNVGLGSFRDDPTLLRRAANYLRRVVKDSPITVQAKEVA